MGKRNQCLMKIRESAEDYNDSGGKWKEASDEDGKGAEKMTYYLDVPVSKAEKLNSPNSTTEIWI